MMRRLISFAAVALLTVTACSGGASTAPTPAVPSTAPTTAVPSTAPTTAVPSTAPTTAALQTPVATPVAETVTTSVVDTAGSGEFFVKIPAGWITITARDIADKASFGTWLAAHPEVPQDAAASVAEDMSTAGNVSLFAFDAENAVGGFTPNLNVTWVDAPVRDFKPWLAAQAATTTKDYGLASPLEYQSWTPQGEGTVGGFIGAYRYSMKGTALAGSQMIAPMPDGRAAVLTFTCRDDQTDHFGPIVQALFTSLSAHS